MFCVYSLCRSMVDVAESRTVNECVEEGICSERNVEVEGDGESSSGGGIVDAGVRNENKYFWRRSERKSVSRSAVTIASERKHARFLHELNY